MPSIYQPRRQYVFTIPKTERSEIASHRLPAGRRGQASAILRGIFRKRRDLLHLLFKTATDTLLSWKHSGFHIDGGGEKPVPAHDTDGRKRLAEYLLRHPFSLQKITWNATTQTVIYRSKRHHNTKRNFEIFKVTDFLAAVIDHILPKGRQTVRYYGLYSNKMRGQASLIPDRIIRPPASSSPNLQFQISNLRSSSFRPRSSKPPAPCAPCGVTSSSKSGVPIRFSVPAARLP